MIWAGAEKDHVWKKVYCQTAALLYSKWGCEGIDIKSEAHRIQDTSVTIQARLVKT